MLHFFTSAAVNYIPKVDLLIESIRKFHPEASIHLALADEMPENLSLEGSFTRIWSVADLGIENWRVWAFGHSIVELATAIKPFVLEKLLAQDGDRVIYMDPDTVLYSRLDDVLSTLDHASIALTPHQTQPESDWQAIWDNEICSLKHGTYNLGFVAVAATTAGRAFAAWWRERCHRLCVDDVPNGLFTDQRWIDLVPALFPEVAILRTPRLNVSTWNLSQRRVTRDNGQLRVNGEPLGFYHYTGFDSGAHRIVAERYAVNSPVVFELIDWYAAAIKVAASDPLSQHQWAFAHFDNGEPVSKLQRRVYRTREDLQNTFPLPFADGGFNTWWRDVGSHEYAETAGNRPVALLHGPKKSVWTAIGDIVLKPGLLKSYLQRIQHIRQQKGLRGLWSEIRSRL